MKEKTYFEILEEMEQDKLKKFDPQKALGALCAKLVKRLQYQLKINCTRYQSRKRKSKYGISKI